MKKIPVFFALLFCAFLYSPLLICAQQSPSSEWMRVQSDNGEFSIEVPLNYKYIYDKDGFQTSYDNENFKLKEMHLLNALSEKTLVSFESYKASKNALKGFYRSFEDDKNFSDIKIGNFDAKQYVYEKDAVYLKTIYFSSKNHIYVITAASRTGETAVMKRFFDSIVFDPGTKTAQTNGATFFSALKVSPIKFSITAEKDKKIQNKNVLTADKNPGKLLIVSKPRPSYVDAARMMRVQGIIRLKVDFSEDGYTPKIEATQILPEGLLRQTLFAAIRIKFLPEEKDGVPQSVTKTIEYSFAVY